MSLPTRASTDRLRTAAPGVLDRNRSRYLAYSGVQATMCRPPHPMRVFRTTIREDWPNGRRERATLAGPVTGAKTSGCSLAAHHMRPPDQGA